MVMMVDCPQKFIVCHFHHLPLPECFLSSPNPPSIFFISKKYVSMTAFLMWDTNIDRSGLGYDCHPPLPLHTDVPSSLKVQGLLFYQPVQPLEMVMSCVCVWRVQVFDVEHTAVGFHPYSHPLNPCSCERERVRCLSLLQPLEALWPARESKKSFHPYTHPSIPDWCWERVAFDFLRTYVQHE